MMEIQIEKMRYIPSMALTSFMVLVSTISIKPRPRAKVGKTMKTCVKV